MADLPGQSRERKTPEGVAKILEYRAAGIPEAEIAQWKAERTQEYLNAGFKPTEVDAYFGGLPATSKNANTLATINYSRAKVANNPWEQIQAGFGMTALGLVKDNGAPKYVLPQNAGLGEKILSGIGQIAGDAPLSVAGFIIGAAAGGGTGAGAGAAASAPTAGVASPVTVPIGATVGALALGGFGSAALPVAAREAAMNAYAAGEVNTSEEFFARLAHSTITTVKDGAIGAITTPLGGALGGKVAKALGGKVSTGVAAGAASTADVVSQGLSATALGGAVEGRLPNADDFTAAVVLGIGTQGGQAVLGKFQATGGSTLGEGGRFAKNNLEVIYKRTGIHPNDSATRAQTNPVIRQELMQQDVYGDPITPAHFRDAPPEIEPFVPSSAKDDVIDAEFSVVEDKPVKPATTKEVIALSAEVISGFEGFIPAAKWDVNAFRTGFGSDTTTDKNGTVRPVTKDTKVTRADAERDRDRRIATEFLPRAREAVGLEWHGLDADTQAALVSVTYNYGKFPENVVKAARTGDKDAIADAVERLQFHNGGVNQKRRLAEAKAIRGGGGGGDDGAGGGGKKPPSDTEVAVFDPNGGGGGGKPPPGGNPFAGMSPEDRYRAASELVGDPKKPGGLLDLVDPDKMIRQYVSELRPARVIDNAIYENNPDLKRDRHYGIEDALRNTYASDDRAAITLMHGQIDGKTNEFKPNTPSLEGARKKVVKAGGNVDNWRSMLHALRTVEKHEQGVDTGMDINLARTIVADKAEFAKYKDGSREFYETGFGILDYAVAKGRYSAEQAARMKDKNMLWVSLRRVQGDHASFEPASPFGKFRVGPGVRMMEGSDKKVVDPIMASIDNWRMIIADADRNEALMQVVTSAESGLIPAEFGISKVGGMDAKTVSKSTDLAPYVAKTDLGPLTEALAPDIAVKAFKERGDAHEFLVFRDGNPEVWRTEDPELAKLLRGADTPGEMHIVLAAMQGVSALERAGITSMPDFALKTTLSDQLGAFVNDPYHPPPFITLALGVLGGGLVQGTAWKRWAAAGGAGASAVAMDTNFLTRDLARIYGETGAMDKIWNVARSPLDLAQLIQTRIDAAQRMGHDQWVRGVFKVDPRKSAMLGRKSYIDFKERATLEHVNTLAKVTAFLRPTILGAKGVGEAIAARPLTTAVAYAALATAAFGIAMLNVQADEELPENRKWANLETWKTDMFLISPEVAGIRFKLPVRDLGGAMVGTINRFVKWWALDDRHAFDQAASNLLKPLLLSLTPDAVGPALEAQTGHSMFMGRPLVPASLEDATGPMQYTENTTPLARQLAKWLGSDGNPAALLKLDSPIVIDNYIRGYLGSGGIEIAKLLDAPEEGTQRPEELADNPFLKGFLSRTPGASAEPISRFYDAAERVRAAQTDLRLAKKRGDKEEFREAAADPLAKANVNGILATLRGHQNHIRAITKNESMTVDEKRQYIEQLYVRMIVVSEHGLKAIDRIEDRGKARNKARAVAPVELAPEAAPAAPPAAPPVGENRGIVPVA